MTLEAGFEDDLREALLDDVEHELAGKQGNLVHEAVQQSHEALRDYEDDYPGVDSIIDSFTGVTVERDGGSVTIRYGWEHEAAPYFAFGTSDHVVDGQPLLVFEFDAAEYPYLDEMFPDGTAFLPQSDVTGIDETRFVRLGLEWLRLHVGGSVQR